MAILKMQRTQTAGNQDKFTFSTWIKKSLVGEGGADNDQVLLNGWVNGTNVMWFGFKANDTLNFENSIGGSNVGTLQTNRVFRDPSAWMHILLVYDSANSTADDRIQFWINGVKETSMYARSNPSSGQDCVLNGNTYKNNLFVYDYDSTDTKRFRGNLAQTALFDGQAYTATDFGSFDTTTGIWKPKGDGSLRGLNFGTNGFLLTYENASYLGYDYKTSDRSSNNDFTTNGTGIQIKDNPSDNFATFNPLWKTTDGTPIYTNGNTTVREHQNKFSISPSTLGMAKGKFYFEAKYLPSQEAYIGVIAGSRLNSIQSAGQTNMGAYNNSWGLYPSGDMYHNNGTGTGFSGTSYTSGDIVQVALDMDNKKVYWGKNGTWMNSGVPTSGSTGTGALTVTDDVYFFGISVNYDGVTTGAGHEGGFECNFGAGCFGTTAVASAGTNASTIGTFEYDVPTGYTALSTKGLQE